MTKDENRPDLLYGAPAIAEALNLRERQARHLIDKGLIPSFKLGKIVCASRQDVEEWLASRRAEAKREAQKRQSKPEPDDDKP